MYPSAKHTHLPFSLPVLYSFCAHASVILILLILGFIPLEKRDRVIRVRASELQILTETAPAPPKQETRKGERRILDPENARPTPPPTPRPTPAPTPPPRKEIVLPPKQTPKPVEKKVAQEKEVIETPKPTPAPRPTPPPKLTPRPEKQQKVPLATPAPPPPPPASKQPPIAPKGDPAAKPSSPPVAPLPPAFEADEASLDFNYVQDAVRRLSYNFGVPGHLPRQKQPPTCVIQFRIHRNGTIDSITVIESTGHAMLDQLAKDAVIKTGRLLPLPDSVQKNAITAKMRFSFQRQ